ncbi:AraC family transcriptional regulator (plasmid) [Rhizobium sp. CC1099]|uniref:AraC family transcriptional regulator n=1 Tax=Rhizobium sp. CC1099 TaxID=3039160 RepID=UPI0024B143CE|nr:AraC family transcriptional regulator [Rhizobium sp. CC1099]WFU91381.1 AraC family transcriptional regulator [Rhizobium sp. CC1099]
MTEETATARESYRGQRSRVIQSETRWQKPPEPQAKQEHSGSGIALARWSKKDITKPLELVADDVNDAHFVTFSVRSAAIDFTVGSKPVTSGIVRQHKVLLQGPVWERRQSIYHENFDLFRIYFSQALLAECFETVHGKPPTSDIMLFDLHFIEDPVVQSLTRALLSVESDSGKYGPAFVDGAGLALASWLIDRYTGGDGTKVEKLSAATLSKGRLQRTLEYIEANFTKTIHLSELSAVAGLSRVHFAAQFRTATGHPPYAYILRRRIEESQRLLLEGSLSTAEVALILGFANQAHFSSAFKKIIGDTPVSWRRKVTE